MDFYYMLVDLFADEEPFSYVIALILTLGTAFAAFVTMNRAGEYIKNPDIDSFKSVKKAAGFLNPISIMLFQWCIFAVVYLITYNHRGGVGALYIAVTFLAVGAAVFSAAAKGKYSKAKNIYNSLYFKVNKGNLSALMGNPLGLQGQEQDKLNNILSSSKKYVSSTKSDPLNDILTGAVQVEKTTPAAAAKENLEEATGQGSRECPFCKKQVEKKFPICIYCGMVIPDRDKDYRNRNEALSGWERVE